MEGDTNQVATAGCLSSILNHFFCTCNIPTHSSLPNNQTRTKEVTTPKDFNTEEDKFKAGSTSPGIVAKLMGLEWMPDPTGVPRMKTLESVGRSRSVNSIGFWSTFDPTQGPFGMVRRSLSFREMPTCLPLDSNESLLHRYENVGESETKQVGLKERKCEIGVEQVELRIIETSANKENKLQKKKKKKGQVCSTRSPIDDKGNRTIVCQKATKPPLRPRKKKDVHDHKRKNLARPKASGFRFKNDEEARKVIHQAKFVIEPKTGIPLPGLFPKSRFIPNKKMIYNLESWEGVCKLTEEDMKRANWKMEEIEEIGLEFELEIFNGLVNEIVQSFLLTMKISFEV